MPFIKTSTGSIGIDPEYVLILSGDHIYSCTYDAMLKKTSKNESGLHDRRLPRRLGRSAALWHLGDRQKTTSPTSKKSRRNRSRTSPRWASTSSPYKVLRAELIADAKDPNSEHDFGKNIIPKMMAEKKKMVAYTYHGYWKDVGTIASLHQANMDLLLTGDSSTNLYTSKARTTSIPKIPIAPRNTSARKPPLRIALINQGAQIYGSIDHCVVSGEVVIEEGASCSNAVLMNGVVIKKNAKVYDALVGPGSLIEEGKVVNKEHDGIALVANSNAKAAQLTMKNDVIGLVDLPQFAPSLGELTANRSLGSTSFLGRYAFCDFALSNFCNSEIANVGHAYPRPSSVRF
jgi:glucose-1-phosphate adenylyltransferase